MRVLTFGWDFPPMKNGGLGVACFGLTRELVNLGIEVLFVLPKTQATIGDPVFIFADQEKRVRLLPVSSSLVPYQATDSVIESLGVDPQTGQTVRFSRTIIEEIYRYARRAAEIAEQEEFDLIHAHDWTAYAAGVAAKGVSGKPLILHVHATAFDQAGSVNVDPDMYQIERTGFNAADSIVAVSDYTKQIIVTRYGIDPNKVVVVHNGCDTQVSPTYPATLATLKSQGKKIVLYHGRITIQKGVDYFVRAAKRVHELDKNVVFVISGWGDMTTQIIAQVAALGLSQQVIFAGPLWDEDRDRMYQSADLVVMPSVSEPFGLVPLEALQHGTPSLISKQSGVSEVLRHTLKVDFWDVDEMANQIVAALRYEALRNELRTQGTRELQGMSWRKAADKIVHLYKHLLKYF